ncbi:Copper-exporting P-type ATPase B [Thiorhodovibrio litoralis]|nr:Copper-exporting P-type ATPase B [Thiorhodovibrio litoralis]
MVISPTLLPSRSCSWVSPKVAAAPAGRLSIIPRQVAPAKTLRPHQGFLSTTSGGNAPALVQADLGIAIGAGTDVAVESADVVLVESDPRRVADVIELSRATYAKMIQNLFWASGYNAAAIPLAAGVGYGAGIVLSPALGAALMSLSTVIVAINAKLLGRFKPSVA